MSVASDSVGTVPDMFKGHAPKRDGVFAPAMQSPVFSTSFATHSADVSENGQASMLSNLADQSPAPQRMYA